MYCYMYNRPHWPGAIGALPVGAITCLAAARAASWAVGGGRGRQSDARLYMPRSHKLVALRTARCPLAAGERRA